MVDADELSTIMAIIWVAIIRVAIIWRTIIANNLAMTVYTVPT